MSDSEENNREAVNPEYADEAVEERSGSELNGSDKDDSEPGYGSNQEDDASEDSPIGVKDDEDDSKLTEEEKAAKIRSANDWEHADLGDDDRKNKFLKLMGAAKSEHTGKIVIGENRAQHKGDNPDQLNKQLEDQFNQGLEHKLKSGYKGHIGLGFHSESVDQIGKDANAGADEGATAVPDHDIGEEALRVQDEVSSPHEKTTKRLPETCADDPTAKKKPLLNFVKASD